MRLWMVPPEIMCRQHLLGEHRECHTFVGTLLKGIHIGGYLITGELDPRLLEARHTELVAEMNNRGYFHDSPLEMPDISRMSLQNDYYVNPAEAQKELLHRCVVCQHRYNLFRLQDME